VGQKRKRKNKSFVKIETQAINDCRNENVITIEKSDVKIYIPLSFEKMNSVLS